jgi:hypothetical protein
VWITGRQFRSLQDEMIAERTRRVAVEQTVAILEQHRQWLVQQVNRLEGERALLLQRAMGIVLPVPEIQATSPTVPLANVRGTPLPDVVPGIDVGALMLGAAAFEDMGDEAAEQEGMSSTVAARLS